MQIPMDGSPNATGSAKAVFLAKPAGHALEATNILEPRNHRENNNAWQM